MTNCWPINWPWAWSAPISAGLRGGRFRVTAACAPAVLAASPYQLTGAQQQALAEIDADLATPHRMLRLLQGDVGSGKTVVALLAMLERG